MSATPGPWRVVLHPNGDRVVWPLVIVEEATDANILTECVGSASANGHLIAAAPDLLNAVKRLCTAISKRWTGDDMQNALEIADAAIKKAVQ